MILPDVDKERIERFSKSTIIRPIILIRINRLVPDYEERRISDVMQKKLSSEYHVVVSFNVDMGRPHTEIEVINGRPLRRRLYKKLIKFLQKK